MSWICVTENTGESVASRQQLCRDYCEKVEVQEPFFIKQAAFFIRVRFASKVDSLAAASGGGSKRIERLGLSR